MLVRQDGFVAILCLRAEHQRLLLIVGRQVPKLLMDLQHHPLVLLLVRLVVAHRRMVQAVAVQQHHLRAGRRRRFPVRFRALMLALVRRVFLLLLLLLERFLGGRSRRRDHLAVRFGKEVVQLAQVRHRQHVRGILQELNVGKVDLEILARRLRAERFGRDVAHVRVAAAKVATHLQRAAHAATAVQVAADTGHAATAAAAAAAARAAAAAVHRARTERGQIVGRRGGRDGGGVPLEQSPMDRQLVLVLFEVFRRS